MVPTCFRMLFQFSIWDATQRDRAQTRRGKQDGFNSLFEMHKSIYFLDGTAHMSWFVSILYLRCRIGFRLGWRWGVGFCRVSILYLRCIAVGMVVGFIYYVVTVSILYLRCKYYLTAYMSALLMCVSILYLRCNYTTQQTSRCPLGPHEVSILYLRCPSRFSWLPQTAT